MLPSEGTRHSLELLCKLMATRCIAIELLLRRLYSHLMGTTSDITELASPELAKQAATLVKAYPECFWFWHPEADIRTLADVRLVVQHLREYGDRRAWAAAQDLNRCLSLLFKGKS